LEVGLDRGFGRMEVWSLIEASATHGHTSFHGL